MSFSEKIFILHNEKKFKEYISKSLISYRLAIRTLAAIHGRNGPDVAVACGLICNGKAKLFATASCDSAAVWASYEVRDS